jgi:hypothetical protein
VDKLPPSFEHQHHNRENHQKGVDKTEMGETAKNVDVSIPSEHTLPFADAPSIGKWRYVHSFNH